MFMLTCLFALKVSAQGLSTAREFGEKMRRWAISKDERISKEIESICDGKKNGKKISTRIADEVSHALAPRHNYPQNTSYELNSYLNWITNEIERGGFSVEFSDYSLVSRNVILGTTEHETKYAREDDKEYVSCRVKVKGKGSLSLDVYDLICMRDGKITLISKFEKVGNKVKVDFSDLVKEHTIEVSYGYSSNFPLNIGLSTNISYFNIGLEYGQSFDITPISFKQHKNFATSKLNGKCFYLMASPGVFLRWTTINCGLGATMATYEYESVYSSYDEKKVYFSMKPRVSFNLPVPVNFKSKKEKLFICPYVGYLYTPKLKDLNGIEFGIGLRFRFETY